MALVITKKIRTILLIVLGVLVIGGGGFLLWRVNQEDTVAPGDSEAAAALGFHETPSCSDEGKIIAVGWACDSATGDPETITIYIDGEIVGTTVSNRTRSDSQIIEEHCGAGNGDRGFYFATSPGYYGEHDVQARVGSQILRDPVPPHELLSQSVTCATAETFTVTYDGNGGTCDPSTETVNSGGSLDAPSCSRTGYNISSFTKVSGTAVLDTDGALSNITSNVTVKVNWVKKTYKVTYDAMGGVCEDGQGTMVEKLIRYIKYLENSPAPKCTRSGYYLSKFVRNTEKGGTCGRLNSATGWVGDVTCELYLEVQWSLTCGDRTCASDENADTCPADCLAVCGDTYCTHDEYAVTCPDDCNAICGDGYCTHDESAESCPVDCDNDCGDGLCTGDETPLTCPADCNSVCGDGYCTEGEDSTSCPTDCGNPVVTTGGSVPQTGVFDTVLGRVSVGVSFIFLGGLVTQYSRFNYLFNSMSQRHQFKKEVKRQRREEERIAKRRKKLEKRFK